MLDQDAIFLDSCINELMSETEKYMFISNRWDPGSIFNNISSNAWEDGVARIMLCFSKRELYDEAIAAGGQNINPYGSTMSDEDLREIVERVEKEGKERVVGIVFDETYNLELITEELPDPKIIQHPASKK